MNGAIRIVVSDYSGHAFAAQLGRVLAGRGHHVLHLHSQSFPTPKGELAPRPSDPTSYRSIGIGTNYPFRKHGLIRRRSQEIEAGKRIADEITTFRPNAILSANAPVDVQRQIQKAARDTGAAFIIWAQDLYGEAMRAILPRRIGIPGKLVALRYRALEARLFRQADHVVAISPAFAVAIERQAGLARERISMIENWAPLTDLPLADRDNGWAGSNLPASPFRMIYAGTLGFKHDAQALLALARAVEGDVTVFSEGAAADALQRTAEKEGLANLHVRNWLPFEHFHKALAGADVLLALLEKEASAYSVPSKVLSYMCAGRPILAAIPCGNQAARKIRENGAGIVVEPDDVQGLVAAAETLRADAQLRREMGRAGRAHAEMAFDIEVIASRFERILKDAA